MADLWTSGTPLSNQDFRKLLSTPRPHDAPSTPRGGGGGGGTTPRGGRAKPGGGKDGKDGKDGKFKKPAPKGKGKPGAQQDDDDEPKYRDRAEERRRDVNPDYMLSSAELAARAGAPAGALDADAVAGLSIEDSKFLGGDLEHTHLVKGLDYALLQQQRLKLRAARDADGDAADAEADARAGALQREDVKFAGAAGRGVFDALFGARRRDVASLFAPRRMAFVYEFDAAFEAGGTVFVSDIPTRVMRSKADCPPLRDLVTATADAALLERIAKIMSYIQLSATGRGGAGAAAAKRAAGTAAGKAEYIRAMLAGGDGRGAPGGGQVQGQVLVRNQAALAGAAAAVAAAAGAAASRPGVADEDDDIFGEAGREYAPELPERGRDKGETSGRQGGYFGGAGETRALPPPPAAPPGGGGGEADMDLQDGGVPSAREQPLPQPHEPWRAPKGGGAAKLKGFAEEAYAECFPEMLMGGEVVGSDDEGGEVVTRKLDRSDFKTDEEWDAHQAKGKGPGRRERRAGAKTVEENRRDQKLDTDLGRIEKMFQEKGFGNEKAFEKAKALEGEGGNRRARRGAKAAAAAAAGDETPAPAKRRRMDV